MIIVIFAWDPMSWRGYDNVLQDNHSIISWGLISDAKAKWNTVSVLTVNGCVTSKLSSGILIIVIHCIEILLPMCK